MARIYNKHGSEIREICSPGNELQMSFIPDLGGLGVSLQYRNQNSCRELLWLHPEFWNLPPEERYGGFPILFPICGRQARDGEEGKYHCSQGDYYLPIHGFAPRIPWDVVYHDEHSLVMQLKDSKETIENYPFSFLVELSYQLHENKLICTQKYTNTGSTKLPYIAGFHPYFRVPANPDLRGKCVVEFTPECRYIYNSEMTGVIGTDSSLVFPASITNPGINESLHRVCGNHNESRLILSDGIRIELEAYSDHIERMFPYLQLFTQKEYDFFCIEPWMGTPNGLNMENGARIIASGETESAVFCIRICNHE